jgi:hypothetical protein
MFFLLKGLLWLALGSGLFISGREVWRRWPKPQGEREPLLASPADGVQDAPAGPEQV